MSDPRILTPEEWRNPESLERWPSAEDYVATLDHEHALRERVEKRIERLERNIRWVLDRIGSVKRGILRDVLQSSLVKDKALTPELAPLPVMETNVSIAIEELHHAIILGLQGSEDVAAFRIHVTQFVDAIIAAVREK